MTGVLLFVIVTAAAMAIMGLLPKKRTVHARIRALSSPLGVETREASLQRSFGERALPSVMTFLAAAGSRLTPERQRQKALLKLRQAGLRTQGTLKTMLAVKGFGLTSGALLACGLASGNPRAGLFIGGTMMALGLWGPDKWLESKISKRKEAIIKALPDVLDLIIAGTEAGLSFDAAVQRIVARPGKSDPELREELGIYLTDLRLGQSRQDALADLGLRCGVDDLKGLVAALLQADQFGIGVGNVLRAQGQNLRARRKQRAQEAAMKVPVKMLFPLVLFIFPTLFIIILGPAALQIYEQLIKR